MTDYKIWVKKDPRWNLRPGVLRYLAKKVLKEEGIESGELSIFLVGARKARQLNITYRDMDYVPQVLAFPVSGLMPGSCLGDIVLCLPLLREEARQKNTLIDTVAEEWLRHGIRNLLGKT